MTLYSSINGVRITAARVTIPYDGAWVADVTMALSDAVSDHVTLVIGDLTLIGTIIRQGAFAGSRALRVVGGGGGWRKVLKPKAYNNPTGVKLGAVLADAARESGETLVSISDRVIGTSYVRERSVAKAVINHLTSQWWISPDGKTHIEPRVSSQIASAFDVVQWYGAKGIFEIATEKLSDWVPGRTFKSITVPEEQLISSVSIDINNDGKLRLTVMSSDSPRDRLLNDIRAIVRDEMAPMTYAGLWEYTIVSATQSTVDATPSSVDLPAVTKCPMFPGVMGESVTPIAGARCLIAFIDSNPARPICIAIRGGALEHVATVEATALLIYNVLVALMALAGGGPLLAAVLQPLLGAAINTALIAQSVSAPSGAVAQAAAAAAQLAGFATGVTPATTSAFFTTAIAGLSAKTDNHGLFPSVGCPASELG